MILLSLMNLFYLKIITHILKIIFYISTFMLGIITIILEFIYNTIEDIIWNIRYIITSTVFKIILFSLFILVISIIFNNVMILITISLITMTIVAGYFTVNGDNRGPILSGLILSIIFIGVMISGYYDKSDIKTDEYIKLVTYLPKYNIVQIRVSMLIQIYSQRDTVYYEYRHLCDNNYDCKIKLIDYIYMEK